MRDVVAHATITRNTLHIVTIDFPETFDNISRMYLYAILQAHGFSDTFQTRIKRMYDNAQSAVQINGFTSSPVPIRSLVRQVCPLSMVVFVTCLKPLLCTLENKLSGIHIGHSRPPAEVVAYADDVTIFVT